MTDRLGLLIVGGGPAGLAAARSFRQHDGAGAVAIVSDEHRMPYQRPPLTKGLLRGETTEDELAIEPESWLDEQRVALIAGRVVSLDPARRRACLSGGRTIDYSHCLLATGAEPVRLSVEGSDHPRVRMIRTLDDVRELRIRLGDRARVVVVGSGFIGCEIASSLRMRGHPVTLVSDETAPNVRRLGDEVAAALAQWLEQDGVELRLGAPLERIEPTGTVVAAGHLIETDVVIMASGVSPRSELAALAGVELADGAIPVDAAMRSQRDGLLAAGDVAKAANRAAGRALRVEHWGDAITQGEIAGATAAGVEARWDAVPGFWSTIGDRTLKYAAWGDGYDELRFATRDDGGFTAAYGAAGRLVGVLTHDADDDYERGIREIGAGAPWRS